MTTITSINTSLEGRQGKGFRKHLGASLIGRKCPRQLWYVFRWAKRAWFTGRMLRLFQRGQEEEIRIVNYLRAAGIHVLDEDPATPGTQFRISDWDDHFGGSLDGKLYGAPEYPNLWILGEFKTHNDKSFKDVKKKGVRESKYEHFVQSQIYMHYEELPAALYFAVNKNDDEMSVQVIEYEPEVAAIHIDRAGKVIFSPIPPPRLPNANIGWYICNWCDYKQTCHNDEPKDMNCRTCVNSEPVANQTWSCKHFRVNLTHQDQLLGCQEHIPIPE